MKQLCLFSLFLFQLGLSQAQKPYPPEVEQSLKLAAGNRPELEKAIAYFSKSGNPKKLEAVYFLLANMDIHYSHSYYWADENGNKVAFDELDYPDFPSSLKAFEAVKEQTGKLHPVVLRYRDLDSIKGDMLIRNVENAFQAWESPWAQSMSFSQFCEYLLPYRISVEPLQDWRNAYTERFAWIRDSVKQPAVEKAVDFFARDYSKWFTNTYKVEEKNEPLPRLGALQLLHRKKGACEDIAGLEVFTLRSQGIAASIDEVPFWATSSGKHFLNVAFTPEMKPLPFDVSTPLVSLKKLAREPAKVIRITYSKQKNVLAAFEPANRIPEGFLRTLNYIDVTKEYWETADVSCQLFEQPDYSAVAYACVFNFMNWRPSWWGKAENGKAVFTGMSRGAVYLPMYYSGGKLIPAGDPVASGYNHTTVLKPDLQNTQQVRLKEQEGYLVFRPGKKYKLLYWNKKWTSLGEQVAGNGTKELVFDNVPRNALLLLLPEYTKGKERPFSMTADGQRLWW